MIQFDCVSKVYENGFKAVENISFGVQDGEFLVLIGPSGSGKSTTMKMINQIIPHSTGTVQFNGRDVTKLKASDLRREIGYVIQQIGLFPHYTIAENVATVPNLFRWDKDRIRKRTDHLLGLVGLDPEIYRDRYPKQLSGGQQQRVGFARALASDPEVILMDEPFGALDPITRDQLQNEILTLQKKLKKTIVFVTHDMDEALKLGDRIAIMKDGKLLQIDTPEKILHEPAHGFVEEFIGKHRIIQNPDLMSITEVMRNKAVTSSPYCSPEKALATVRREQITSLIIIDDEGVMLGTVSAYDLVRQMDKLATIKDIMKDVKTVLSVDATAKDAILKMQSVTEGIIPVVDESNRLQGLVTRGTLLAALSSQWTEDMEVSS